jgi:hypothetical protein
MFPAPLSDQRPASGHGPSLRSVIESRLRSRDPFGRRELYGVEAEAEAFTGESLRLVVRRRGYYGKVEGWRPAEIVERQHVRGDDPSEIGEARAELESLAELRNQAAWDCDERHGDPADCDPRAPCAGSARRCSTPSNAGVSAGDRGDRLELGVRVWHYGGWLDGSQSTATVHGMSVPADDPVALGEARAKLQVRPTR